MSTNDWRNCRKKLNKMNATFKTIIAACAMQTIQYLYI